LSALEVLLEPNMPAILHRLQMAETVELRRSMILPAVLQEVREVSAFRLIPLLPPLWLTVVTVGSEIEPLQEEEPQVE
jgi:hypothetical protein